MRKVYIFFAIAILTLNMTSYMTQSSLFNDMSHNDWFFENVSSLVDEGIIVGYGDGQFKPNRAITVDQFIKTMVVAMGYDTGNGEDYWASKYIDKGLELGFIKENEFIDTRRHINREEMAMIAVRVVESLENKTTYIYNRSDNDLLLNQLSDRAAISNSAKETFVSKSYELGLITGYPDGSFKPIDKLKRSEACTVIRRVIDQSIRQPFEVDDYMAREEELEETHGFSPFSDGHTEGLVTKSSLKNDAINFSFDSGLSFSMDDKEDGVWSLIYTCFKHEDFPTAGNQEIQLYEVEYILKEVVGGTDDMTIEDIANILRQKEKKADETYTKTFVIDKDKKILVRGSTSTEWDIEIIGTGF